MKPTFNDLLSAQCISSIGQIIKSVCLSVNVCVSLSHKRVERSTYRSIQAILPNLVRRLGALNKNMQIRPVGVVAGVT